MYLLVYAHIYTYRRVITLIKATLDFLNSLLMRMKDVTNLKDILVRQLKEGGLYWGFFGGDWETMKGLDGNFIKTYQYRVPLGTL